MLCYDCKLSHSSREAIGICSHCGGAVCDEHAFVESEPLIATWGNKTFPSVRGTYQLPRKARRVLCRICRDGLTQGQSLRARQEETPTSARTTATTEASR